MRHFDADAVVSHTVADHRGGNAAVGILHPHKSAEPRAVDVGDNGRRTGADRASVRLRDPDNIVCVCVGVSGVTEECICCSIGFALRACRQVSEAACSILIQKRHLQVDVFSCNRRQLVGDQGAEGQRVISQIQHSSIPRTGEKRFDKQNAVRGV